MKLIVVNKDNALLLSKIYPEAFSSLPFKIFGRTVRVVRCMQHGAFVRFCKKNYFVPFCFCVTFTQCWKI